MNNSYTTTLSISKPSKSQSIKKTVVIKSKLSPYIKDPLNNQHFRSVNMWDRKQIETDGKLVELPCNHFNKRFASKRMLPQLFDNESDFMTITSRDSNIIN
jgi:hypothetical protein